MYSELASRTEPTATDVQLALEDSSRFQDADAVELVQSGWGVY